jgi:GT2 family glycosyltransferase
MPATATIDAIVPVYGGWEHVEPCIRALLEQTLPVNIVVVDDCGPDDTADRIAETFPAVELIRNSSNRGFAATCNRGIASGEGDIVVLVNSDVVAEPDLMESIAAALDDAGPSVGSVCPLLMGTDGSIDSQGITADATCAGFVRYHRAPLSRQSPADPPVLGPYGAVAAYRRSALDEVGVLDEGIFMYGEELDLALRLRAGGYGTVALDRPGGVHIGGASAGEGTPRQIRLAGFGRGYLLRAWGHSGARDRGARVPAPAGAATGSLRSRRPDPGLEGRSGRRAPPDPARGDRPHDRLPPGDPHARRRLLAHAMSTVRPGPDARLLPAVLGADGARPSENSRFSRGRIGRGVLSRGGGSSGPARRREISPFSRGRIEIGAFSRSGCDLADPAAHRAARDGGAAGDVR